MSSPRNVVHDQARAPAERIAIAIRGANCVPEPFNEDGLRGPTEQDSATPREALMAMLETLVPNEPLPPPVLPPSGGGL